MRYALSKFNETFILEIKRVINLRWSAFVKNFVYFKSNTSLEISCICIFVGNVDCNNKQVLSPLSLEREVEQEIWS